MLRKFKYQSLLYLLKKLPLDSSWFNLDFGILKVVNNKSNFNICWYFYFRSARAANKIAEMFSNRTITKQYWAVTVGIPTFEEGEINIPIGEAKLPGGHRIVTRTDLIGKSNQVWLLLIDVAK